jgi:methanogenic corrinoid protein MtbC1
MQSRTALQNLKVQEELREKGVMTSLYCQVGGGRGEASWEKQVPRFMDFLWM